MKHAKEKQKQIYNLYLSKETIDYLKSCITGVSLSQYIDDILLKEASYIKALDDLYRKNKVVLSSIYGEVKEDA